MANNYQILSEDAIKYLCGLIRDLASVSEGIDNINLADDKTFSNIYIKNLIDKCLEDANAEAEKLVGALTHLTCEETAIQPTLDNSEINVIYLYSANGNPPYQQFLKISEDKLVDLGSTSISLEDYIKAADVAKDYATKIELKAVTDKIGTTTLTTTDTTITGAIEEVKGIADDKAEILDSEKNDVNTWSSNKIANEITEVKTELNAKLDGKADKNTVFKSTAPIGTVLSFAGQTAPNGYLLCNGASYKVANYPDLYAVIGNTYGGDTENFNVPTVQPPALTMVYIIKAFHTNEGVDSDVYTGVKQVVTVPLISLNANLSAGSSTQIFWDNSIIANSLIPSGTILRWRYIVTGVSQASGQLSIGGGTASLKNDETSTACAYPKVTNWIDTHLDGLANLVPSVTLYAKTVSIQIEYIA